MSVLYYPKRPDLFALRFVKMYLWGNTDRIPAAQLCCAVIVRALDDYYNLDVMDQEDKYSAFEFLNSEYCYDFAHNAGIGLDRLTFILDWIDWFLSQPISNQYKTRDSLIIKIKDDYNQLIADEWSVSIGFEAI